MLPWNVTGWRNALWEFSHLTVADDEICGGLHSWILIGHFIDKSSQNTNPPYCMALDCKYTKICFYSLSILILI